MSIEKFVTTDTGECTACAKRNGGVCSPPDLLQAIEAVIGAGGDAGNATAKEAADAEDLLPAAPTAAAGVIRAAAKKLGCKSESCVVATLRPELERRAGKKNLQRALVRYFKAPGPRESTALTSNFDLDGTLSRWAVEFPAFFPYPFAMMDFLHENWPLARWPVPDVLAGARTGGRPMSTAACILNTDVSTGAGKHWVCVFVDARSSPVSVEYFNSAGNPPPSPVTRWMEQTREALIAAGRKAVTRSVTSVRHQQADTECGLYALLYIRARLEGKPATAFEAERITDSEVERFRRHVFRRHAAGGNR